jgi:hypothetical protein
MNCELAQDVIFQSDDPEAVPDADVARHVQACGNCRAVVERLARIEDVARGLTVPVIDQDHADSRGVGNPVPQGAARGRRTFLRPMWVGAVAALLLIGVGLGLWMWPQEPGAQVVENLIDWNLQLADADAPQERERIYKSTAPQMESAVRRAKFSDEDRATAARLLADGAWLSQHGEPTARAEKVCDLTELLVGRMDTAAAADDAGAVGRLGPKYGRAQKVGANLKRLHPVGAVVPENQRRLERIAKRQAEAEKRLAAAAAKFPERAARQALRRALMAEKRAAEGRDPARMN